MEWPYLSFTCEIPRSWLLLNAGVNKRRCWWCHQPASSMQWILWPSAPSGLMHRDRPWAPSSQHRTLTLISKLYSLGQTGICMSWRDRESRWAYENLIIYDIVIGSQHCVQKTFWAISILHMQCTLWVSWQPQLRPWATINQQNANSFVLSWID